MKNLFLISSLLLATQVFASTENFIKVPKEEGLQIMKAINADLKSSNLECIIDNRMNLEIRKVTAKDLGAIIGQAERIDKNVFVSEGEVQPVIKIERHHEAYGYNREIFYVTTNPEFTKVESIDLEIVNVSKIDVNVGTILKPVFESRNSKKIFALINCK